jgi:hypothetical protein
MCSSLRPRLDAQTIVVEERRGPCDSQQIIFFEIVTRTKTHYILCERNKHICWQNDTSVDYADYEEQKVQVAPGFTALGRKIKMRMDKMHARLQGQLRPKFVIDKNDSYDEFFYLGD